MPAIPSGQNSFLNTRTLSLIGVGAAGVIGFAAVLAACTFDPVGPYEPPPDSGVPPDAEAKDAIPADADNLQDGGDGGIDPSDAGLDAGISEFIPNPIRPLKNDTFTPRWVYLSWAGGVLPEGKDFDHYEVCWKTEAEVGECPNGTSTQESDHVLTVLAPGVNYFWKVRAVYTDRSVSEYSAEQAFSTDNSLLSWQKFDGDLADASDKGNNGFSNPLQEPVFLSNGNACNGLTMDNIVGQAACFDGVDDLVILPASASLDPLGEEGSSFTIAMRVRTSTTALVDHEELFVKSSTVVGRGIAVNLSNTNDDTPEGVNFEILDQAAVPVISVGVTGTSTVVDQNWHLVFASLGNGELSLFVDERSEGTVAVPSIGDFSSMSPVLIGGLESARFLHGAVDDLFIASKVISPRERENEICATQFLTRTPRSVFCNRP